MSSWWGWGCKQVSGTSIVPKTTIFALLAQTFPAGI